MKFSSYNWPHKGERGWIIGPWFKRCMYITIRKPPPAPRIRLWDKDFNCIKDSDNP
jgi:hypothetical protein